MTPCSPAGCTGSPLSSRRQVGAPLAQAQGQGQGQGQERGSSRWVGSAVGRNWLHDTKNHPLEFLPPVQLSSVVYLRGHHGAR